MNEYTVTVPEMTLEKIGQDAIGGYLKLTTAALFIGDVPVGPDTPYSAFELGKANYAGYAPGAITWSAVTRADDGTIEFLGTVPEFRPTDGVSPNMIRGVYVRNGVPDNWVCAVRFEDPGKPMESTLDSIRLTIRYRPGNDTLVDVIS